MRAPLLRALHLLTLRYRACRAASEQMGPAGCGKTTVIRALQEQIEVQMLGDVVVSDDA